MAISEFIDEFDFLSNFYPAETMYDGIVYPTSEHAFAAAKSLDLSERDRILQEVTPGRAKRLGRRIELRRDWEDVKVRIMKQLVLDKFTRNSDLMMRLLETGSEELIEGNNWGDKFWGVCDGEGQNYLGIILMEVRDILS